jgi:tetratricopeptide (TPR) repeat protein
MELGSVLTPVDPRKALGVYDHVLMRLGEVKNNAKARRDEVSALAGSTYALRALGRTSEARKRLESAFAKLAQSPASKTDLGSEGDRAITALADLEAGVGNVARAIALYRESLDRAKPKAEVALLSRRYAALEALYRRAGESEQADALAKRRGELPFKD